MAVSAVQDDRRKALSLAISQIEKNCGKGSIMRMGTENRIRVESIPTGAINLDAAIGIGGIPRGRITEIYGPESSGKTTLCLHIVANAQRAGGVAAFIDAEHALDIDYAKKLGVDVENLLVSQPDTGEQALEICEILVRSGAVDVVVVDSVAALVPKAEIEGDMGDSHVGLQARLMSQALRKLTGAIARSRTSVIFINQLREKIGVMFGNPETTTGGKALKFYASLRLDIRRIGPVKDKEEVIGSQVRVKVVKNKVAPPFKQAEFDIMYAEGISHTSLLVDIGSESGIIEKSGAWYSYNGQRIGQGRENAKLFLKDNLALQKEIEEKVKGVLGITKGRPRLTSRSLRNSRTYSAHRRGWSWRDEKSGSHLGPEGCLLRMLGPGTPHCSAGFSPASLVSWEEDERTRRREDERVRWDDGLDRLRGRRGRRGRRGTGRVGHDGERACGGRWERSTRFRQGV
ncbi:MAG: recombinase RecA [Gemmatimonadaceae bacterium]